ncbi:MAG: type II toxin-antitoxin system VapB family antitoxin [Actinomycetota bacterium]
MVRRTTIDIDDERLAQAQRILGTSGLKDTVYAAFDEVVRIRSRERLLERLRTQTGIDSNDEVLNQSKSW